MSKSISVKPLKVNSCGSCPFCNIEFVRHGFLNLKEKSEHRCTKLVNPETDEHPLVNPSEIFRFCPLDDYE